MSSGPLDALDGAGADAALFRAPIRLGNDKSTLHDGVGALGTDTRSGDVDRIITSDKPEIPGFDTSVKIYGQDGTRPSRRIIIRGGGASQVHGGIPEITPELTQEDPTIGIHRTDSLIPALGGVPTTGILFEGKPSLRRITTKK